MNEIMLYCVIFIASIIALLNIYVILDEIFNKA